MAAVLSEHLTCYKYNIHLLISARNSSSYGLVQITSRKETAGRTGSGCLPAVHVQVTAAQTELLQGETDCEMSSLAPTVLLTDFLTCLIGRFMADRVSE